MEFKVSALHSCYDFIINGVSYMGAPRDNTAMFVTKKVESLLNNLAGHKGCLVFAEDSCDVPEELKKDNLILLTSDPQKEYAEFVSRFADTIFEANKKRHYTMTEGKYTLGENVSIGANTYIEPGCFIDHDVVIGKNGLIKSGCRIRNAVIGDNFIANENSVIGALGFTMAEDEKGNKIRIPTLGKVLIGSNVEIGTLVNISCGSGNNTIIEDYVKVDTLVHIGHDAHICKNVELTAGTIVGGFVIIKEKTWVGINSCLRNRISLGQNTLVGMGSVVTKSVDDGLTVVGNPAKVYLKNK